MMEQPDAAERHRNAVLVAGVDHLCVADGAARLYNGGHAAAARALDVIAEREEGITAQAHTGHGIQPGALFLGGQRGRLLGEGLGPDIVADDILRRVADVNIDRVVAVRLGNVSAAGPAPSACGAAASCRPSGPPDGCSARGSAGPHRRRWSGRPARSRRCWTGCISARSG